jgi:hypothetical protein
MAGQKSHKRSLEETRSRRTRKAERGKAREAAQHRCAQANLQASRLKDREIEDMHVRHGRGEVYRSIGRAYGLDEFTVARVLRYGRLSPWQASQAKRAVNRKPLREEWARKNKKDQLSAS